MLLHGGDIYDEEIQKRNAQIEGGILDFSANINPCGMPERVRQAVMRALDEGMACHYPDPQNRKLRQALSLNYGLPAEYFLCGNGGADLIYRLVYALRPKRSLLTVPTFSEYEEALHQTDAELLFYRTGEDLEIREDILDAMDASIDVLFLCNPNNPTGLLIDQELLLQILRKAQDCGILLALDECFLDFTGQEERSLLRYTKTYDCLLILKSFTKLYAMPGLRLGFAVSGNRELLCDMAAAGQCWGVSVLAAEAGIAALEEREYKESSVEQTKTERAFLKAELEALGLQVWDGQADYLFFRADGVTNLYERLLPYGILIRRCGNYRGLRADDYRTAVKGHPENVRLLRAMREVLI